MTSDISDLPRGLIGQLGHAASADVLAFKNKVKNDLLIGFLRGGW